MRIFHTQEGVKQAFKNGEFTADTIVVVRFQGPRANGMPELHSLTPTLSVLQDRGLKVALVTDGRMSGASGKVPAAIHVSPEAACGGPLARLRDGDLVRLDQATGTKIWTQPLPFFENANPRRQQAITPHFGPVLAGGRIVVASGDGQLRFFSPTDGASLGSVAIPGGASSQPALAGGVLYVVSGNGQLLAFR